MTSDLRPFVGRADDATGIECRIMRAALGLEKRSVAAWANLRRIGGDHVTTAQITSMERSKGRGYPPALVEDLARLDRAVAGLAGCLADHATENWPWGPLEKPPVFVVHRPLGGRRIHQLLSLPGFGLVLSLAQMKDLDALPDAREILPALADAATVRAVLLIKESWGKGLVRVEHDREPDNAVSPFDQEAPAFDALVHMALQLTASDAADLAEAALTFKQAMIHWNFPGDEFRSLMERAPVLMRHIADNMEVDGQIGVHVPMLRAMGMQGQIVGDEVRRAILRAAPAIERDYALWNAARPRWAGAGPSGPISPPAR